MSIKGLNLAWIVVNDLKKAVGFYTDVVGLKLEELNEQFGWAELSGSEGGARLGIAQQNEREAIQPGQNAVVTMTVENLVAAKERLIKKGAKVVGEVVEVPGMVKLQMVKDGDNNHFQLVEMLGG
ncbi:MAG: VOC family protein [Verrucomicrobiota bacterium]|nr:VOC family protein [Verrucomicrobiota bacterium]